MNFRCPFCSHVIRCSDQYAGKTVACPKCSQKLIVPQPTQPTAPNSGPPTLVELVALAGKGTPQPTAPASSPPNQPVSPSAESPFGELANANEPLIQEPRQFGSGPNAFVGFLIFEKMITPWLLIVLYWLSVVFFIGFGLFTIITSLAAARELGAVKKQDGVQLMAMGGICSGFAIMFVGPIVSRVYFETLIVVFLINETLIEIRDKTRR